MSSYLPAPCKAQQEFTESHQVAGTGPISEAEVNLGFPPGWLPFLIAQGQGCWVAAVWVADRWQDKAQVTLQAVESRG